MKDATITISADHKLKRHKHPTVNTHNVQLNAELSINKIFCFTYYIAAHKLTYMTLHTVGYFILP